MNLLQRIHDTFTESMQTHIEASDRLPTIIETASRKIVQCLLNGNKILSEDIQQQGIETLRTFQVSSTMRGVILFLHVDILIADGQ